MTTRRFFSVFAMSFLLMAGAAIPVSAATTYGEAIGGVPPAEGIHPQGDRAIEDLRRCLTSSDTLNVFYLIDNSGSLAGFVDPPGPGTDPDFRRVGVITESLRSLTGLSKVPGAPVINFSMGFFSSQYKVALEWQPLNQSNLPDVVSEVDRQIRVVQPPGGFTNWEDGITQAQRSLQRQQAEEPGCSMMIWLTDGGINVNMDPDRTQQSAVNLCGTDFAGFGATSDPPNGVFNSLRQSGVSVFAVLLNADPGSREADWARELMRPLAEGTGTIGGVETGCGLTPVPADYAAGAYLEADNLSSLANQFLRLSARISGGRDSDAIGKDGIAVAPGVTQIQVIGVDEQAILTSPTGRVISPASAGETFITATVDSAREIGTWKITSETWEPPALVWGALQIEPAQGAQVAGGAEQYVEFTVDTGGNPVAAVSDYVFTLLVTATYPDGSTEEFTIESSSLQAGSNRLSFVPNPQFGDLLLRFQTQNLRTAEGAIALAEVLTEVRVEITPPTQFPVISAPSITQALVGSVTPAAGQFVITGPEAGTPGEVCISGLSAGTISPAPTIQDDSAGRTDDWEWTLSSGESVAVVDDCVQVAGGQEVTLQFSAYHPESADSVVRALVDFALRDSDGIELPVSREVFFPSERVFFSSVANTLRIVLLVLGALLPLLALYLVNLLSTKIDHGRDLRRAVIPILYDPDADEIRHANNAKFEPASIDPKEFKFLSPRTDARRIEDGDLGSLVTKVPINPLQAPWFEVVAKSGDAVFTGKSSGPLLKNRFLSGERALVGGQMSKVWALSFPQSALDDLTEPIRGKLVVFSRNQGAVAPRFDDQLTDIVREAKISSALKAAAEARAKATETGKRDKHKVGGQSPQHLQTVPPPPPGRGGPFFGPPSSRPSGGPPPPPPPSSRG